MTKEEAKNIIVHQRSRLIDPVEMLALTHLLVVIGSIEQVSWDMAVEKATGLLSR